MGTPRTRIPAEQGNRAGKNEGEGWDMRVSGLPLPLKMLRVDYYIHV